MSKISRIEITISVINTDGDPVATMKDFSSAAELLNSDPMKAVQFKVEKTMREILRFLQRNS